MTSGIAFGRVVVLVLFSGMLAASAQAQFFYGASGMGSPYGYPYPQIVPGPDAYGYGYSPGSWYGLPVVPPPSRYLMPSFSYNANPYAQFPNTFSYEIPQNAYAPNSYTYDLRAYGYGYLPPIYYVPPLYFYRYYPNYYPDLNPHYRGLPGYRRGVYRQVSLQEYLVTQFHGPVRVRDIVPGVPELGG